MKKCLKITVSGKLQGEAYLSYAQQQAQTLGIEGTLQKNTDGNVIIHASGTAENLDQFIDFLYKGTTKSQIADLIAEPYLNHKDFRGTFRVIEN